MQPQEMKQVTNHFLVIASSAGYFLISWPLDTTVEYFLKIGTNFQWSKSLAGKTFAIY